MNYDIWLVIKLGNGYLYCEKNNFVQNIIKKYFQQKHTDQDENMIYMYLASIFYFNFEFWMFHIIDKQCIAIA